MLRPRARATLGMALLVVWCLLLATLCFGLLLPPAFWNAVLN